MSHEEFLLQSRAQLAELQELLVRRERLHQRVRRALEGLAERVQGMPPQPCVNGKAPVACGECPPCALQMAYLFARLVLLEPANVVGQQVASALAKRPAAKLTDGRLKRCLVVKHSCCVCGKTINRYQRYFDGGVGKWAHEDCARRAS